MKKNLFITIFLISVIGVFGGIVFHVKWLDYIFKPIIMISIGGHFLLNSKNIDKIIIRLAIFAFLFSFLGDSFLMFVDKGMNFFIFGLVSFLVAQIAYIFLFGRSIQIAGGQPFLRKNSIFVVPYFIYGFSIYILLFNHIRFVLKIAVFIYMLALIVMSSMALNRFKSVPKLSFSYVFLVLFCSLFPIRLLQSTSFLHRFLMTGFW